jgi:hypothetical protein
MSKDVRASIENGIWMCYKHGTLIDTDESRFTVSMLKRWRELAELRARLEVELGHSVELSPAEIPDLLLVENSISFSRPGLENELIGNALHDSCLPAVWGNELADAARDVLIELLRNAFQHGGARRCQIRIEPKSIRFVEDGSEFNPWDLLMREQGGGGVAAVNRLLSAFGERIITAFRRTIDENEIVLALATSVDDVQDLTPCVAQFEFGPEDEVHARLDLLESCKTIYVVLPDYLSFSDTDDIVNALRPLLDDRRGRSIVFVISRVSSAVRRYLSHFFPGTRIVLTER